MGVTDPLADMFTVLRNANRAKIEKVEVPSSKMRLETLTILKKEGYIKNFKYFSDSKQGTIRVYLKFSKEKTAAITQIKRISKPGRRIYVTKEKIPQVIRGMGMAIISSSSGLVSDTQARKLGVGGEVICYVW